MRFACLILLALAPALWAAPPDAPKTLKAEPGDIVEVVVKVPAGQEIGYRLVGGKALFRELKTDAPGERVFWFNAKTAGTYSVVWWTKGETASTETTISVGGMEPAPDPKPKPEPKPDPPKPQPVTSFRVILVFESGATLTAAQHSVLYGREVEAALNDLCTKDASGFWGWRRRDKDTQATGDTAEINAFWGKAKPKVMAVPCIAIEVNGSPPLIESLPATPAATVALLKKYAGGK